MGKGTPAPKPTNRKALFEKIFTAIQ